MWKEFLESLPEGYIKPVLILLGQIVLSILIFLTENTIATIIIALADSLIILWFLYKKIKSDLKQDYKDQLAEKDRTIAEKNVTISSLQSSLRIKKGTTIDAGDPLNK